MIILFEENERSFSTLGLGVLKDAISCTVSEKLNDEFTLTMEYPVSGAHFDKLRNNRIIFVRSNPYSEPQAFRISNITKSIKGTVVVDANHISYDANNVPVKAFSATSLQDAIVQIQNGSIVENPFVITSDILYSKTFKTTAPYNLRAILLGGDESVASEFEAEAEFDNYAIKLLSRRGKNRGGVVRYGHNMTDINHVLSTDLLYNGIFPYYHTEKTTTETTTANEFTKVYIVGSKPYTDGWLSYSKDGEAYHPVDESPVQIATEGDYYEKVYAWNILTNTYEEKIYNEQVTLIQGVTEPSWLVIDWSKFPKVTCKAARNGYYKKATDTDWGDIKSVGDIIFEESIVSSGILENIIINFAEVIPSRSSSKNEEVSEVVDVQLDPPILWIETSEAKNMLHDRILMVDLTSEFDDEPTQTNLKAKAEEYIRKNNIGTVKHSTTLSFIDLSSTTEASRFENMDHVEIGDTVKVIYEDAGIEIELRVISTKYDAILGRYTSIELGEKEDTMSSSSIQNGDNVSSLTNDSGYTTPSIVNKLIADIITANYIQALNAKLSEAQINQLMVERINCTGIIEASQFTIDTLVAKLLIADEAQIANTLTAGNIKVAGDISVNSGQITIGSDEAGTSFIVDREGNLTANSVTITGGSLDINNGIFSVSNDGKLIAQEATITGTITADSGSIGGFVIEANRLYSGTPGSSGSVLVSPSYTATISVVSGSKDWAFIAGDNFGVTTAGELYAKSGNIGGFKISTNRLYSGTPGQSGSVVVSTGYQAAIYNLTHNYVMQNWAFLAGNNFGVTTSGALYARSVTITGDDCVSVSGTLYNFTEVYPVPSPVTVNDLTANKVDVVSSLRGTGLYISKNETPGEFSAVPSTIPPRDSDYENARWYDILYSDEFILDCSGMYSPNYLRKCKSEDHKNYHSIFPLIYGYAVNNARINQVDNAAYISSIKQAISGLQIDHYSYDFVDESETPTKRYTGTKSVTELVERGYRYYSNFKYMKEPIGGARVTLIYEAQGQYSNPHPEDDDESDIMTPIGSSVVIMNSAVRSNYETSGNLQVLLSGDRGVCLEYISPTNSNMLINLANEGVYLEEPCGYSIIPKLWNGPNYGGWIDRPAYSVNSNSTGSVFIKIGMAHIAAKSYYEIDSYSGDFKFLGISANVIHAFESHNKANGYSSGYAYYRVSISSQSEFNTYNSGTDSHLYYLNGSGNYISASTYSSSETYYIRRDSGSVSPIIEMYSESMTNVTKYPRIYNPNAVDVDVFYVLYLCDSKVS